MKEDLRRQFAPLVKTHFGFLEEFGFHYSEQSKTCYVIFESHDLEVVLCFDFIRGGLELGFARPRQSEPVYGLGELIKTHSEAIGGAYRDPFVKNETELAEQLSKLAELLRQYGGRILAGDHSELASIDQLRSKAIARISRP